MQVQTQKNETEHEVRNINKKRRGGRPRLTKEERRLYSVKPGFTEHEFEKLEARAESVGLDPASFIRRLSLNQPFYSVSSINRSALAELSRIGNNVNQISKAINTSANARAIEALDIIKTDLQKLTLAITTESE